MKRRDKPQLGVSWYPVDGFSHHYLFDILHYLVGGLGIRYFGFNNDGSIQVASSSNKVLYIIRLVPRFIT